MYYHNNNWQVLCDYNEADVFGQFCAGVYPEGGNATIHTAAGLDGIWLTDDDVISQSTAQNNPYLFTGRTVDTLDNTNLKIQYNRNRYYNQKTATWLTHDPLGYTGMNLYEYVGSNPVSRMDPQGLDWVVHRLVGLRAEAEVIGGDCDTTIEQLAPIVKHDIDEYYSWLQLPGGTIVTQNGVKTIKTLRTNDKLCPGTKVTVPNSFIIALGKMSALQHFFMSNHASKVQIALLSRGFYAKVMDWNLVPFTSDEIGSWNKLDRWGFALFGHGTRAEGFVEVDYHWTFKPPFQVVDDVLMPAHFDRHYKMGGAIVYACWAGLADWDQAVSSYGKAYTSGITPVPASTGASAVFSPMWPLAPPVPMVYTWDFVVEQMTGIE